MSWFRIITFALIQIFIQTFLSCRVTLMLLNLKLNLIFVLIFLIFVLIFANNLWLNFFLWVSIYFLGRARLNRVSSGSLKLNLRGACYVCDETSQSKSTHVHRAGKLIYGLTLSESFGWYRFRKCLGRGVLRGCWRNLFGLI